MYILYMYIICIYCTYICIIMYISTESREMVLKNLQGSNGEIDIENRLMDMAGGGEGEMYGKSNMEIYITICKIDSQWEFAV